MCADAQIRGDPDLPTAEQSQLAAATLRMLAEPTRLRILWALFSGEQSVGRLAELVGVAPSAVSQHLAKLRLARLVSTRREGTRIFYAATDDRVHLLTEEALFRADHVVADLPGLDGSSSAVPVPSWRRATDGGGRVETDLPKSRRRAAEYSEGDVFAVPLPDHGWVLGVLARTKGPVALGYFFKPVVEVLPETAPKLVPEDAFLVKRFGDLGLLEGTWPVLGRVPVWDRWDWPIPDSCRREPGTGRAWRVRYPDTDPGGTPADFPISQAECLQLPMDVQSGAKAVEMVLAALLGPASEDHPGGPIWHARAIDWRALITETQKRVKEGANRTLSVVPSDSPPEQSLRVQVRLSDAGFGNEQDAKLLESLETKLTAAVDASGAGVNRQVIPQGVRH